MTTDTERLEFLVKYMTNFRVGYPSVGFFEQNGQKSVNWGFTSFCLYDHDINETREMIDYCMEQYQKQLKHSENKNFDE